MDLVQGLEVGGLEIWLRCQGVGCGRVFLAKEPKEGEVVSLFEKHYRVLRFKREPGGGKADVEEVQ